MVEHLIGLPAPTVSVLWTTHTDNHDEPSANTSLADLARRHTLVVYFTPSEDEGDGPTADTMSRVYKANQNGVAQLGALIVGVSTQTALEQQLIASAESFPQPMLADDKRELAKTLDLPTVKIDGRDEYEPLAIIIRDGLIAHVEYPISSAGSHIDGVLRWLAQHEQEKLHSYTVGAIIGQALTYLEQLRDETAYTISMGILDGAEVVCVRCLPSSRKTPAITYTGPGVRLPAHCTAMGKVLLANLPTDEQVRLVSAIMLERHTETTFTDIEAFCGELKEVRESTFAVSDGEYIPGLQAIAVGIYDGTGGVVASIGMSAQSFESSFGRAVSEHVGYLRDASEAISARLGAGRRARQDARGQTRSGRAGSSSPTPGVMNKRRRSWLHWLR